MTKRHEVKVGRSRWRRYLSTASLPLMAATGAFLLYSSCGGDEFNVFRPAAEPLAKKDDDAQLEEARVMMDDKEYDDAANLLEPRIEDEKTDSNEARLLYAAALLGIADLDVWSIINTILESQGDQQAAGGGGLDTVFDSLSDSILGSGAVRQAKVDALAEAIATLRGAPEPDAPEITNTACLFGGLLAAPTLADARSGLAATATALATIRDSATSGGATCPDISLLDTASAGVIEAAANFSLVLQAAGNCSFLDLSETAALMNSVEQQMSRLLDNADKGCASLPECPADAPGCESLFPTCVQEALEVGTSTARAGDGAISSCELVLHCSSGTSCFR